MTHPLTTLRTVDQDPISAMLWADEITDKDDRTMAIQYLCGHLPLTVKEWDEGVRMARAAVRIGAAEEWGDELRKVVEQDLPNPLLRWAFADCALAAAAQYLYEDEFRDDFVKLSKMARGEIAGKVDAKDVDRFYESSWRHNDKRDRHWLAVWATQLPVNIFAGFHDASECPGYPYVLRRLTYLCKAWAVCGEKAPALLYEGRCPIDWEDTP